MVFGLIITIISFFLSFYTSFYTSPRFKASGVLDIHKETLRLEFEEGASKKVYYSISSDCSAKLGVKILFYDKSGEYLGEVYIEDPKRDGKGYLVLNKSPNYAMVKTNCRSCTNEIAVNVYYSVVDQELLSTISISSMLLSIIGAVSLIIGVSVFLVEKTIEQENAVSNVH